MKILKYLKQNIALIFITILSAVLNLGNLAIEGTGNAYYAAAAKSMTMSFKNFFFVAFDPSGFVTLDKPPVGYWLQAISAKIFGYSGWSILLPQALAGVISIVLLYKIVKRSFGKAAGLISALILAVTPVFVAASRNNTVDNVLVMVLLFACWAMTIAAEKGKFKYLILSMALIGIGFNVKMLQAYMIIPALYITYLLSTAISFKKRIFHLIAGTLVLIAVSLSWAIVVDMVPASSRPYIDSSTNNTVMELILGHNGLERLSLSSGSGMGGGTDGNRQAPPQLNNNTDATSSATQKTTDGNTTSSSQSASGSALNVQPASDGNMPSAPDGNMQGGPGGNMQGGGSSGLQGSFGGQLTPSVTRLFTKNILSDQIVWFLILAVFGFIATAIKEKLKFKLDNSRKQQLVMWIMWFLPVFVYFSFNTGLFHPYYLTMLAPPAAALSGIGIVSMWEQYKQGGWKSWLLPAALIANGAVQLLMLYYFVSTSVIIKVLMVLLAILCFGSASVLSILNLKMRDGTSEKSLRLKKIFVALAVVGLLITPLVGSGAAMVKGVGGSMPAAGLELLSNAQNLGQVGTSKQEEASPLIDFLLENKTSSQKYLLVVSSSSSAADIIIKTGEPVMAIGGFLGSDNSISLIDFKKLVEKGEVRYVLTGGNGGGGGQGSVSEIMNWVTENGTSVSQSEYSSTTATTTSANDTQKTSVQDGRGGGGMGSGTLYDLAPYTDSLTAK